MKAPILDPSFKWIPSRDHDAGSEAFRERQRQRMKAAQEAAKATNVAPINVKQKRTKA